MELDAVARPDPGEEAEEKDEEDPLSAAAVAAPCASLDAGRSAVDCAEPEEVAELVGELAAAAAASSKGGLLANERCNSEVSAAGSLTESPSDAKLEFQPLLLRPELPPIMLVMLQLAVAAVGERRDRPS
jgi:hypothetical protein